MILEVVRGLKGMVRKNDHETSIAAAAVVKRVSLREKVKAFAEERHFGFTDEELWKELPGTPESSLRKRRTELTEENIILDSGLTTTNSHGQTVKLWVHREWHPNPPPIKAREYKEPASQKIARYEAIMRAHNVEF